MTGTPLAALPLVRLSFDRGTLLIEDPPAGLDLAELSHVLEVRWDPRVGKHRAPAHQTYRIASELRRRGVRIEAPRPALDPPSGVRPVELRPYQEAALAAWRLAGRRGVIALPTGSGKTHVALGAIAATRTPALLLVPTRALLAQWLAALAAISDGVIGRFGDGERVLAPVTVATYAGAYRHMARLGDRFGLVVVDEAHHFGAGVRIDAIAVRVVIQRSSRFPGGLPTKCYRSRTPETGGSRGFPNLLYARAVAANADADPAGGRSLATGAAAELTPYGGCTPRAPAGTP